MHSRSEFQLLQLVRHIRGRQLGNNNGYVSVTLEYSMRAVQFIHHICVHTYIHNTHYVELCTRQVSRSCDIWGGLAPSKFPPRQQAGVAVRSLLGCSSMAVRGSAVELGVEPISDGRSTGPKMQIMQTARHRKPRVGLHESRSRYPRVL